ncbi:hypothetical protein [Benzoatithermus flavus]|uniref:Uncharacterized protein n=1 Tax=Benzoatithermus flavus TaxID=3108223 RepID=A0ABU8XXZ1_9PROT
MAVSRGLFAILAWLLLPPFGNRGTRLAFLLFLTGRGFVLGLIYWRAGQGIAFVPARA